MKKIYLYSQYFLCLIFFLLGVYAYSIKNEAFLFSCNNSRLKNSLIRISHSNFNLNKIDAKHWRLVLKNSDTKEKKQYSNNYNINEDAVFKSMQNICPLTIKRRVEPAPKFDSNGEAIHQFKASITFEFDGFFTDSLIDIKLGPKTFGIPDQYIQFKDKTYLVPANSFSPLLQWQSYNPATPDELNRLNEHHDHHGH